MVTRCKSILIVEDDLDIRTTLKQILEFEGYSVFTATNGKEGLEELGKIPRPCVILLDMMMPIMNGWEFMKAQKEDVLLATIPVVIVSAAGERASSTPGAAGFIKKPIELNHLFDFVKRYCG